MIGLYDMKTTKKQVLSIIVAVADNGVIGKQGRLPWYLPAELAYFKQTTMDHPIIMGRKTHDSIGWALPGRTNIVITRDSKYKAEGCEVVGSLDEALSKASTAEGSEELFVIGGESIYALALPKADKLYVTNVKARIAGNKFFKYDSAQWREVWSENHQADANNKYDYRFVILKRVAD